MAVANTQVCVQAFGVHTTQIAAGQVRLPYLKHPLPCAPSKKHLQGALGSRPDHARPEMPGIDRWVASLAAATERLITSCSRKWPCPSQVCRG